MLTLKLPAIVLVRDYHEFEDLKNAINCVVTGGKVKIHEFGASDAGEYVGVVFHGKHPKDDEVRALLNKKKILVEGFNCEETLFLAI